MAAEGLWGPVYQSLPTHEKTTYLTEQLNKWELPLPQAKCLVMGMLSSLWLWALDRAESDGKFTRFVTPKKIAEVMAWDGDAQVLVDALIDAEFMESVGECLKLHNWYQYAGKLNDKREADKKRKAAWRAGQDADVPGEEPEEARDNPGMSCGQDADKTRTSRGQDTDGTRTSSVTEHNQEQYQEHNQKPKNPPKPPQGGGAGEAVAKKSQRGAKRYEYSPEFGVFWGLYPRQTDKAQAWTRFNPLLERLKAAGHGLDTLLKATDNYATAKRLDKTPEDLIKQPATFLYQDVEDIFKQANTDPIAVHDAKQQARGTPAGRGMGRDVSDVVDTPELAGKYRT